MSVSNFGFLVTTIGNVEHAQFWEDISVKMSRSLEFEVRSFMIKFVELLETYGDSGPSASFETVGEHHTQNQNFQIFSKIIFKM